MAARPAVSSAFSTARQAGAGERHCVSGLPHPQEAQLRCRLPAPRQAEAGERHCVSASRAGLPAPHAAHSIRAFPVQRHCKAGERHCVRFAEQAFHAPHAAHSFGDAASRKHNPGPKPAKDTACQLASRPLPVAAAPSLQHQGARFPYSGAEDRRRRFQ